MVSLEYSIRKFVKPLLVGQGYLYDNCLSFRKVAGNRAFIVCFQKGKGAATGEFTVNLSIYTPDTYEGSEKIPPIPEIADCVDCKFEWRERLGSISETWFSKLMLNIFGPRDKWWKDIFAPKEKWWKTPKFEEDAEILLRKIGQEIIQEGIPWLEKIET